MLTDQETHAATDLYKVLNVDPGADAEVVRAAYRALARRDHPDLSADPSAASKMVELNGAFEVLGDPERRAAYDQSRIVPVAATARPTAQPVAPTAVWPTSQPLAARAARSETGTVLEFGRYSGWSLADLAAHDPDYLEWLARTMIGHAYQDEIEKLLTLRRPRPLSVPTPARGRKGFFGRLLG